MSIAAKYRPYYTYDEYCEWEGRWELIEGMPYAMSPMSGPLHQRVNTLVAVELQKAFKNLNVYKVYPSIDWKITEDTVVRPDIIICNKIANEKKFLDFPPTVIVEILSTAAASKDREEKMELYLSQQVKYYLIVDPKFKKVEIFGYINSQYHLVALNPETYLFTLTEDCTVEVNLLDIWD